MRNAAPPTTLAAPFRKARPSMSGGLPLRLLFAGLLRVDRLRVLRTPVRGIVEVSNKQRLWHDDFARRWHERSRYIVSRRVELLVAQRYRKGGKLAEMRPVEEMLRKAREIYRPAGALDSYDLQHRRVELDRVGSD